MKIRECRHCGAQINEIGMSAIVAETGQLAKWNYYGGWVCSKSCDIAACKELESSMPGAGPCKNISQGAKITVFNNWDDVTAPTGKEEKK